MNDLTALLDAYAVGVFPMADHRSAEDCYFIEPKIRGIIPLNDFNIPRSLQKFMRRCDYKVTVNKAFDQVIAACAETPRSHEKTTWINHQIEGWFNQFHAQGYAHSVEVWDDDKLIGGLYGLAQGGCFNGESMFSRAENASKIALVHLVERLRYKGFTLLDTQFANDHLKQFGCIEIPQAEYKDMLEHALQLHVSFT
jgi:leucyl/phenylalanyl-tRNA--protein transferase